MPLQPATTPTAQHGADARSSPNMPEAGRRNVEAQLVVRASAGPQRTHIRVSGAGFPVAIRRTGPARAHLVGTGAWPLGGDTIKLTVVVAAGTTFEMSSVAAMVVLPGPTRAPAKVETELVVEAGATLRFDPGPTIVAADAELRSHTSLSVAAGGQAMIRDLVLLGRHQEEPGTAITRTDITVTGQPIVRETLERPAGTAAIAVDGGMRGLASLSVIGDGPMFNDTSAHATGHQNDQTNEDRALHQAIWPLPHETGWRATALGPKSGSLTAWSDASWAFASDWIADRPCDTAAV